MALAYRLGKGVGTAVEGLRPFAGEHLRHSLVQMALVLLQQEDVVRPAGAEGLDDRGLATHGIDRHDAALQFQQGHDVGG